jgi:hypothetical protein
MKNYFQRVFAASHSCDLSCFHHCSVRMFANLHCNSFLIHELFRPVLISMYMGNSQKFFDCQFPVARKHVYDSSLQSLLLFLLWSILQKLFLVDLKEFYPAVVGCGLSVSPRSNLLFDLYYYLFFLLVLRH